MTTRVLSYKYPYITPSVTGNQEQWSYITASNASTQTRYTSRGNSSLIFTLASNASYVRTHQTWLQFTLTPLGAGAVVTGANAICSAQGVSRAFSEIIVRQGATTIERFQYDDIVGQYYATLPDKRRVWLTFTEGFEDQAAFANGGRRFGMQIFSSIFTNDQHIPLPILPGGLQLEFVLAPVENLFLNAAVDEFVIDNPQIRTCMVTPDPSFTIALTGAIASGKSAWLPMTEIRQFNCQGLNSDELQINCQIGSYTSVDGCLHFLWDRPTYNARTNDRYKRYSANGLREWNMEIAGLTQPQQRRFVNGPNEPETTMVTFISESGSIHNVEDVANLKGGFNNYYTNFFRFGLNFVSDNELHGTGVSTIGAASTNIVTQARFAQPITADTNITSLVTCSVLLEITAGMVNVWKTF